MKNNLTIWPIFVFAYLFCSCKAAIVFKNYFPLQENKVIIYEKVVDSTKTTLIDTLICSKAIAATKESSNWRKLQLFDTWRGERIKADEISVYSINSASNLFGSFFATRRICCFKEDRLYVWDYMPEDLSYNISMDLLFPKRLKRDFEYRIINGDYRKSFRYVGKETITANNVLYKNCLKMNIYETFGSSKRIGTVWFAKGIGMVKWLMKNEKVSFIYRYQNKIPPEKP